MPQGDFLCLLPRGIVLTPPPYDVCHLSAGLEGKAHPPQRGDGICEEHRPETRNDVIEPVLRKRDLGVSSIRLRTTNARKYVGLAGFGIEIAAVEALEG